MSNRSFRVIDRSYEKRSQFSSPERSPINRGERDVERSQRVNASQRSDIAMDLIYRSFSYPGQIQFEELAGLKQILLDLIDEFKGGKQRVVIDGQRKDQYERRLLLLEHQINGLMKQQLIYEKPEGEGTRQLDYSLLLHEKQSQIIQLQKKIYNLEGRLKKRDLREAQLQDQIIFLQNKLKAKNQIIEQKEKQLSDEATYIGILSETLKKVKRKSAVNDEIYKMIFQSVPYLEQSSIRSLSSRVSPKIKSSEWVVNEVQKLGRGLDKFSQSNQSIQQLQSLIEGWIIGLPSDSSLKKKILEGEKRIQNEEKVLRIQEKFKYASELYKRQIETLRKKNIQIEVDKDILSTLKDPTSRIYVKNDGVVEVEKIITKTIQVPIQDHRTKQLLHKLALQMKRMYTKYPKLYSQIDPKLAQFFSQELVDIIEVDEIDRLLSVVKYEPHIVKVQNVYAYNSEKTRKVQFHLRILLKAILTEMEKLIVKTGIVPEIDEGIIGLIKEEIMDLVNIDDILKVYRTVPKIVQVEKVIEKVVEKVIQIPKLVPVQSRIEIPVQVKKIDVVENVKNIPLQVPKIQIVEVEKLIEVEKIVQRIVEVPQIIQKIVQVVREVPKVQYVEKVVQKPVQVFQVKEIIKQKPIPVPQYQPVTLEKEKIVPMKQIVQIIKEVPVYRDRVQEVIKEIPKIIEVQKKVEIIVEKPVYQIIKQIKNQIVPQIQVVQKVIEKIVPIIKIEDRVIEVPTVIEKVVQVRDTQTLPPTIKEVVVQKPIYKTQLKQIQVVREVPVQIVKEVQKTVDKFIQVPVIHEVVRIEKEYIKEPYFQKIQSVVYKEIQVKKPIVLYEQRCVEVEKIVNHIVEVPKIINIYEDKIIPLETIVKEPIPVPTVIEKIVQKLVQVPKVVEVQKIIQKIVPIPRVVEKVVEVEKIVQKVINKPIIETKIQVVQKRVDVPVFREQIRQIEVPRNVYLQKQVQLEIEKQILVKQQIVKEKPTIQEIHQPPKPVIEVKQVPVNIYVDKIVPLVVEAQKPIFLEKYIPLPVEIEIPKIIQKKSFIPVEKVRHQVLQIERVRELVVEKVIEKEPVVIEIPKVEEKVFIQKQPKVYRDEIPVIQTQIKQIRTFEDKIVPVVTQKEKIIKVVEHCDRIVDRIIKESQIVEVEKVTEKILEVPKLVEVEKIVPHIVNVNRLIETVAERIVEIPILIERWKQIQAFTQKIVQVRDTQTQLKVVDRTIEKEVIQEKIHNVTSEIVRIEEVLKYVDKTTNKNDPVLVTQEKVIEVPLIVEKIVEKVVVMPQIVEVLKHVYEIIQEPNLGAKVDIRVGEQQIEFKTISNNLRTQIHKLITKLKVLASSHPSLKAEIEIINRFSAQLEKLILYPRIHEGIRQIIREKEVEKLKVVSMPQRNQSQFRMELSKTVLIEKLIRELKEIKRQNNHIKFNLDEDIKLIFGPELNTSSSLLSTDLNRMLTEYSLSIQGKFKSMGGWTSDHEIMLNTFLEQRFFMANTLRKLQSQLQKTKALSQKRLENIRKYKFQIQKFQQRQKHFDFSKLKEKDLQIERLQQMVRNLGSQLDKMKYQQEQAQKTMRRTTELDSERNQREIKQLRYQLQLKQRQQKDCVEKLRNLQEKCNRLLEIQRIHQRCQGQRQQLEKTIYEHKQQIQILRKSPSTIYSSPQKHRQSPLSERESSRLGVDYRKYEKIQKQQIKGAKYIHSSGYKIHEQREQQHGSGSIQRQRQIGTFRQQPSPFTREEIIQIRRQSPSERSETRITVKQERKDFSDSQKMI